MIRMLLRSGDTVEIILSFLAVILAALGAIILHENAHGIVALWCGDDTAKLNGRISLNPAKHFDIFGFIMFIIIGFGWARPVPVNPYNYKHTKLDSVLVALAGVITNVILAFICCGLLAAFFAILENVNEVSQSMYYFLYFVEYLFFYGAVINLTLMAFNILPIYPLDGFRIIEALAPNSAYVAFMRKYGQYILLGFIILSYALSYVSPYLNVFSLYINAVVKGILNPIFRLFGVAF